MNQQATMNPRIRLIKLVKKDVEFWLKKYDMKLFNQIKLKEHFFKSTENYKDFM